MAKKFEIRNSTAEFLYLLSADKEQGLEVLYKMKAFGRHKKLLPLFLMWIERLSPST